MGFLDRAKKLAEQAKDKAEQTKDRAEEALAEARARAKPADEPASPGATAADPRFGTPYVSGMLGRPAWRERGLVDPAAVVPAGERDRAGVPAGTRSEILEEPYGMGRRWSSGGRSIGVFYQLYPEHQGWEPQGARAPLAQVGGASVATLPDGRSLVFLGAHDPRVVLEMGGLDDSARAALARAAAEQLTGG